MKTRREIMGHDTSVFNPIKNRHYPSVVRAENIYLYDSEGKQYMDTCSGPVTCCLGYGLKEFGQSILDQCQKVQLAFRFEFTTPELEEASRKIIESTKGTMDKVFMVSGGSEAVEIAAKFAIKYHLERKEPTRYKIISRWLSYHGSTQGALSWTGMPGRRMEFDPMLNDSPHIAPGYCYRCWFGKSPELCNLECANALENEIMCQNPETVAAFIMEPVSGSSLCGAYPRKGYYKKIREICDRHGVLLIFDEVMTGFGRTGKWYGYENFDIVPDIMAVGKGMGGGYFPVGAAVITSKVAKTIEQNSGNFIAGHTWAGNPMAAAVVCETIEFINNNNLIERSSQMGEYLSSKLKNLQYHPTVGDIRGIGMMQGIEFVNNKDTRKTINPEIQFSGQLEYEAMVNGLYIFVSNRNDRGQSGDMALFSPAYIVTEKQVDEMVERFDEILTTVEKQNDLL